MYNEHRPTPKQMLLSAAVSLGGILAAVLVVAAIAAVLISNSAPKAARTQAPAAVVVTRTAEAQVPSASATPSSSPAVTEPVAPAVPLTTQQPKPTPEPAEEPLGVVVIDAGHQAKANPKKEPVGPGASATKPKVMGGATGVATGNRESEINLAVALKLRDQLRSRNVRVVMVRTTQQVDISNSERAKIGNAAHADLTIRIHCNGAPSSRTSGLMTIYPETNRWTKPIVARSKRAAKLIHREALAETGAKDAGCTIPPTTMTGFNWSTVPSVIVEMGFMSNPADDRRLAQDAYQKKLAKGMAQGIVQYLQAK